MPTFRACGRALHLAGFPSDFERRVRTLLDAAPADEPGLDVRCEGGWSAVEGAGYAPTVRPLADPDWPWLAASRLWSCRFHPGLGAFRFALRPLRSEPTLRRVTHVLRLPVLVDVLGRGGRLLHGAALAHGGVAGLFVGASGEGKTTLARKLPAEARLADDTAIVLPEGARFVAWPSPFPGREGLPAAARPAPVAGLFVLSQAPRQALLRLPPAEAFRALVPHVTPLRAAWSGANPLEPLAALVERVPAWRLCHTLDTDPRAVLQEALG